MSVEKKASIHQFLRSNTLQALIAFQPDNVPTTQSQNSKSIQLPQRLSTHQRGPDAASLPDSIAEVPVLPTLRTMHPPAVPSEDRASAAIIKFASEVFGVDVTEDAELMALAREAHVAPVDLPWLEYSDSEGYVYYYNSSTKETSWDHPMTAFYRERLRLKQLELRSQVMSARIMSSPASHRSDIGGLGHRAAGASVDNHRLDQLHFLNLGPAVRISSDSHKAAQDPNRSTEVKEHDAIHVAASTAQFSSLAQLLYDPNASPSISSHFASSPAPLEAKVLAMKASSLDVSINNLESLNGLAAFSGLLELHVHTNQLSSLQHLPTAPFLLTVLASKNLISSISLQDIAPMQLQHLDLSNNRISNVSALAAVPSLTFLNLSANHISAISGFITLTNLHTLKIANNSLLHLAPSTFAPSLQNLDVHSNGLADARQLVVCLRSLKNLHSLIITQNPVEKAANFQVDVVAAAPSLKELNYLVIKQGFREELQLAAVSGIVDDASQMLKLGYVRAIEREQQRLQQCINSTKLKEVFYEKAFEGYKKKLEAEFGAAIHRVQSLSTDAVASNKYDAATVAHEAAAVVNSFAQASNATGDFGRAVASDVFAQSSSASADTLPTALVPLKLRSFDADKEAAIFELTSGGLLDDNDDDADAFPEIDTSATIPLSTSLIPDSKSATTASTASPRLTPALSLASVAPAQSSSTGGLASSSSTVASSAPVPLAVQRPVQRPRPLSPKPASVKALRTQDSAAMPPVLASSSAVPAPAALHPSPPSGNDNPVESQETAVRASSSCVMM